MSDIVLGIAASHTTLMNTQWDKVEKLERAHRFRDALRHSSTLLCETRPDLVVVIGSNHFRGQWLDLMPAFLIGVDEVEASGEHGTPKGLLHTHPRAAQQICEGLLDSGFDLAFSTHMSVDHGISHAVQWLVDQCNAPVVPLVVNCFAPPLPSLQRALDLGACLRRVLSCLSAVDRLAVIGTGGLSHSLPFPDWRRPETEDDKFLADSWRHGRGHWERYEKRRRALIVNAPPRINEDFDRAFLQALQGGVAARFARQLGESELIRVAGNGANEIRSWLAMAGSLGHRPAKILNYSPMPEWLTGMAVAIIEP